MTSEPLDPAVPDRVGPYRILSVLGEGGMGIVYLAEQTEPVRRRVALKILKVGMDTRQIVARFEAERQALALMEHPNIARVLDAGATEEGTPYFVMELVPGPTLTEYCDRNRLTTRQRLELFLPVCRAIQHAHQKSLIHRDLKPSNILVATVDGGPIPKVIDFGIAKALGHALTDLTVYTQPGQFIGTPAYMSPEQASGEERDVDTLTDVYSLGVVLHELLVGRLPFDLEGLGGLGALDLVRAHEPRRPSTRYGTLSDRERDELAARRRTDPFSLRRELKQDLDWIVLRAMARERSDRYETALSLAREVERYLAGEPIRARPPSLSYRFSKLARRHRGAVAAVSAVVLALVAGAVMATAGLVRARSAEARAEAEAAAATEVADFLVGIFEVSSPGEALGSTITAREILETGARRIRSELADQPATRARLLLTLGRVYESLGLYEEAAGFMVEALEEREALLGPRDPDVAEALQILGSLHARERRHEDAERLLERAVDIHETTSGPDALPVAVPLSDLANVRRGQRRFEESEALHRRVLAIRERLLAPDDPAIATTLHNLGVTLRVQNRFEEARTHLERALAIRRRALGPEHPATDRTLNSLAILHSNSGDLDEAERLLREAMANKERVLGASHPELANSANNLAVVHVRRQEWAEARDLFQRALEIREASLGPDHPSLSSQHTNLAFVSADMGDTLAAELHFRRAVDLYEKAPDGYERDFARTLDAWARLLRARGREREARPLEARAQQLRGAEELR